MKTTKLLVGVAVLLFLSVWAVPKVQAQVLERNEAELPPPVPPADVADLDAGEYVGEAALEGAFDASDPSAWAQKFAEDGTTVEAVYVSPTAPPIQAIVILADGTVMQFTVNLARNIVAVQYYFPDGNAILIAIVMQNGQPVIVY